MRNKRLVLECLLRESFIIKRSSGIHSVVSSQRCEIARTTNVSLNFWNVVLRDCRQRRLPDRDLISDNPDVALRLESVSSRRDAAISIVSHDRRHRNRLPWNSNTLLPSSLHVFGASELASKSSARYNIGAKLKQTEDQLKSALRENRNCKALSRHFDRLVLSMLLRRAFGLNAYSTNPNMFVSITDKTNCLNNFHILLTELWC